MTPDRLHVDIEGFETFLAERSNTRTRRVILALKVFPPKYFDANINVLMALSVIYFSELRGY